jgi:hypothetical protein
MVAVDSCGNLTRQYNQNWRQLWLLKMGLQLWLKTAVVTKRAVTADEFAERSNGSPAVGRGR